jgi:hypothetical protein
MESRNTTRSGRHGVSRLTAMSWRYTTGRLVPAPRAHTTEEVTMGFMDKAKQMAGDAAAKAKETAADLQEKAGPAMEKAKQGAADLGEKAKPAFEKAKQDAGELAGRAKEKLSK